MSKDLYELVGWPECQELMDKPGFEENCHLVEQSEYIGSSTYAVSINWLKSFEPIRLGDIFIPDFSLTVKNFTIKEFIVRDNEDWIILEMKCKDGEICEDFIKESDFRKKIIDGEMIKEDT